MLFLPLIFYYGWHVFNKWLVSLWLSLLRYLSLTGKITVDEMWWRVTESSRVRLLFQALFFSFAINQRVMRKYASDAHLKYSLCRHYKDTQFLAWDQRGGVMLAGGSFSSKCRAKISRDRRKISARNLRLIRLSNLSEKEKSANVMK